MERYVCIHGHFYQPPRENPWLEDVEQQDSAYPHHDWNTKITQECYRQNAASRILAPDKKIIDIVNNYASISCDFGPTLLYWLQTHAPDVYQKILAADKAALERFSGHGCAIAQPYNHMIMPLANDRDEQTQVIWGIRDFEMRFGRRPEGMWLPETALDVQALEILAEHSMKFTILAPRQARRVRRIGSKKWNKVNERDLDTTRPYLCNLPSGKSIALFFYDGRTSHDVAYHGLLHSGENFAARLLECFADNGESSQLVHIATDGESFGHHHRHGDMALAYCLHHLESKQLAKITVYGEYLEKSPPSYEVEIRENTSWSCAHGLERWKSNCGCHAGRFPSGLQQWREPLRQSLDWLRDNLAGVYEKGMDRFNGDPWQLRNEYIEIINNRSPQNVQKFISASTGKDLSHEEQIAFVKLLEMQRHAMLMYTSCGWFFDDIAGEETVQILEYAARAMQLANEVAGIDLEPEFLERIAQAPANAREFSDGRAVYQSLVKPRRVVLNRVGVHFAVSSLFQEAPTKKVDIYCYSANMDMFDREDAGIQVLASGRATISSKITLERYVADFAVLHFGDHNLIASAGPGMPDQDFSRLRTNLTEAFRKGDTTEVMRLMSLSFGGNSYSLWDLFSDEQRRILHELLATTWEEIEASFRHIYEHNYTIMQMIRGMKMPLPKPLATAAEFILNQDLRKVISGPKIDLKRLGQLADEVNRLSLQLDERTIRYEASSRIGELMVALEQSPENLELLNTVETALEILKTIVSDLDLQTAQNVLFTISRKHYPQIKTKSQTQDQQASEWVGRFERLADHLGIVVG